MKKFYLLSFDEDYGDEHDVPAIECFTEEQYKQWLETPSGKLNESYEKELTNYENYIQEKKVLVEKCIEVLGDKWGHIPFTSWPKDLLEEHLGLEEKFGYTNRWPEPPKKCSSFLRAYLGNSGECFEESFEQYYLCKEFVGKVVNVIEVNEDFYKTFHEVNLSRLSLCNIFNTKDLLESEKY